MNKLGNGVLIFASDFDNNIQLITGVVAVMIVGGLLCSILHTAHELHM